MARKIAHIPLYSNTLGVISTIAVVCYVKTVALSNRYSQTKMQLHLQYTNVNCICMIVNIPFIEYQLFLVCNQNQNKEKGMVG